MRALISVSDKAGIVEFARGLSAMGVEIISTGGTYNTLVENEVSVVGISDITGFPECLDGRVKTLHPAVHGGILAMRDSKDHMKQLSELDITPIDIVVINLYPFRDTILKPGVTLPAAIENIDIGGPTMLRSAAKNHKDVIALCDPADYDRALKSISEGGMDYGERYILALKVFEHTAAYDAMIASYLREEKGLDLPGNPTFTYEKIMDLRYGENPHQEASYYRETRPSAGALVNAAQLGGKELSFNNINDTNSALAALREFDEPTVVAVKHANPCGVGSASDIEGAYQKAFDADPVSIFGGIIAANRVIGDEAARRITEIFIEVIVAPGYTESALNILRRKENMRVLELKDIGERRAGRPYEIKQIDGGILLQRIDNSLFDEKSLNVVTKAKPTEKEWEDLKFAMKVVKHVKSNAIVIARDCMTLGVGPGQTNRIGSVEIAVRGTGTEPKDLNGSVLASDAFFPFDDCVTAAAAAGIKAIIQPGGSINDKDSIAKADELGIAMVFTGERHFKH